MSLEKVKAHFEKFNMQDRIRVLDKSSATVELASIALGCEEDKIAKTLSFMVDDKPILVVVSGKSRIDNSKFKAQFHTKAKMIAPDIVEDLIGHSVGGVCPFGINEGVKVYLDISLKRHNSVFPACGSSNSAIELTIDELMVCAKTNDWIDICKNLD